MSGDAGIGTAVPSADLRAMAPVALIVLRCACMAMALFAASATPAAAANPVQGRDCSGPHRGEDRAAKLQIAGPAVYPHAAARAGLEADVVVEVDFTAAGRVTDARVARTSGSKALDRSALSAAKETRVSPGVQDGCAIGGSGDVTFSFRMRDTRLEGLFLRE